MDLGTPSSAALLRLPLNTAGRDFVVGDIHGQYEMLSTLLQGVAFEIGRDRLIALGDLIDRGPSSEDVVEMFATTPGFYSILGNHEFLLLQHRSSASAAMLWNGSGNAWSVRADPARLSHAIQYAGTLPLAIEVPLADGRRVGLIHAEMPLDMDWADLETLSLNRGASVEINDGIQPTLLWGRSRFACMATMARDPKAKAVSVSRRAQIREWMVPTPGIDLLLCGHSITPGAEPITLGNHVFIDTGGSYPGKGRMTLVEPLHHHYWQVENQLFPELVSSTPRRLPNQLPLPMAYSDDQPKSDRPPDPGMRLS